MNLPAIRTVKKPKIQIDGKKHTSFLMDRKMKKYTELLKR